MSLSHRVIVGQLCREIQAVVPLRQGHHQDIVHARAGRGVVIVLRAGEQRDHTVVTQQACSKGYGDIRLPHALAASHMHSDVFAVCCHRGRWDKPMR